MEKEFYEYDIANGKVSSANIGDNITYCPPHVKGDCSHFDAEHGRISTVDERGIFVRFKSSSGQKCPTKNLYW